MTFASLNWGAVIVAALAAFFIGFLWHGPLFGKPWMKMMGITKAQIKSEKAKGMVAMYPRMGAALVQQIVIAIVMSHLAIALSVTDATGAVMFAVLVWLGFIVTTFLNAVLWENRKINLYLFNIVYHLVSLIAVSLIVVLWK